MRALILQRQELVEEVIAKKWLAGVKKWWNQWVKGAAKISTYTDAKDKKKVFAYLDDGEKRLRRIKDNLDYKKGIVPYPEFLSGGRKQNIKQHKGLDPRVDLSYMFKDAFENFSNIRGRLSYQWNAINDPKSSEYRLSGHGTEWGPELKKWGKKGNLDSYGALVESLVEEVAGLNQIVSGRIFRRLNRFVGDIEKLSGQATLGSEGETELSVGKSKVIFDTGARDPSHIKQAEFFVHPSSTKAFVGALIKAKALLDKAGFGKAWYGEIFIRPKGRAKEFKGHTSGRKYKEGAHWSQDDSISIFTDPSSQVTEMMVHEIGHRWYYKFMNQAERARFGQYFGEVPAVSSYGSEIDKEDFAEVFRWYVLGKKLTRDQRERFKQFALKGGKIKRHEDEENTMRKLIEKKMEEAEGSGLSVKWNDRDMNGRLVLTVDGKKFPMFVMWAPAFGADKGKFKIDIRYPDAGGTSLYAGKKAPRPAAKKKVKSVILSELQKAIDFMRSKGKKVEV